VVQSQDRAGKIQDPRATTSRPHGRRQQQEKRRALLPAKIRTCSHRPISQVDKKPPKRQMRMVSIPVPDCQSRDHLLKSCLEWKTQQKVMWEKVKKETGRWKSRWKIRDLFADPRCSQAVLDFLASTQVGRRVPTPEEEEEDAQSEVSEWELRSARKGTRRGGRGMRQWERRRRGGEAVVLSCTFP